MRAYRQGGRQRRRTGATAREEALALLGRRMLSEKELLSKLISRGHGAEEAADALAMVRSYRYVDDNALIEALAAEAERTARGPGWFEAALYRRQVDAEQAEQARRALSERTKPLAQRALRQRFGDEPLAEPRMRRRAFAFLMRRGFSPSCAADALAARAKAQDEADADP